ncbi:MAG: (Fe-S)-binding protein [Paenibacillaceae bacterium]|jgi:NAD-dependent dihydropyrimidine dehydrogenase PreA subunit|nr:(Fe-S)-binding protein [Paenibacillaceae bacterium]
MKRSIIQIHEELCNGCGVCVDACHEGAIELIDGKAVLVSDIYCDGLGACLPNCPTGAIEIIEREAEEFDEAAVEKRLAARSRGAAHEGATAASAEARHESMGSAQHQGHPGGHGSAHGHQHHGHQHHGHHHGMGGCPGSMAKRIERPVAAAVSLPVQPAVENGPVAAPVRNQSELQQWPIQISLVNPAAPFFQDANLLIAADCTAFAYADFHRDFIANHITVIGCPKLDDNAYYAEKLAQILKQNNIKSITVVRMVVPCCGGIVHAVKQAMLNSQTIVPYREVTIGIDGQLVQ